MLKYHPLKSQSDGITITYCDFVNVMCIFQCYKLPIEYVDVVGGFFQHGTWAAGGQKDLRSRFPLSHI